MKNFMVLVVLAILLSGCATENPYYQDVQVGTGTVVGALAGYKVGGNVGGVLGAIAGHDLVKGAQYKPPVPVQAGNVIIIRDGARRYNPCPAHDENGSFVPEGYRRDYRSGGITREGCGEVRAEGSTFAAVYATQAYGSSTSNAPKKQSRLTVDNYMGKSALPPDSGCQTGNWGMDSSCLMKLSVTLDAKQKECVAKELVNDPDCIMNPGILSQEYAVLSKELDNLQRNGGK